MPDLDALRRLLYTFAQLSAKEMIFVHAILQRKTVWDAACAAGYKRASGRLVAWRIARRHPEFASILAAPPSEGTGKKAANQRNK